MDKKRIKESPRTKEGVCLCRRQLNDEACALVLPIGLRPDTPAMGFDDFLRDVEAVAGGVHVCLYGLFSVAAFGEEILHIFRGNADAVVFDREAEVLGF